MKFILDTNPIYYLDNSKFTDDKEYELLLDKKECYELYYSPVNVIELVTRVNDEPSSFPMIKGAVKKLLKLGPKPLPDPETRMQIYISNIESETLVNKEIKNNFTEMLRGLSKAPNLKSFKYGYPDVHSGRIQRKKVKANEVSYERKKYERRFIKDMSLVLKSVNEDLLNKYDIKNNKVKLNKEDYELFEGFLESDLWDDVFIKTIESRTEIKLPSDEKMKRKILINFEYFKQGYEVFLTHIFKNGYLPNKNKKNDYHDLHQLTYVNENNENRLVTIDSKNPMFTFLKSKNKSITYEGFLSRVKKL